MSFIGDKMGTQETQDQGKCEHPRLCASTSRSPLSLPASIQSWDIGCVHYDRLSCVFLILCGHLSLVYSLDGQRLYCEKLEQES